MPEGAAGGSVEVRNEGDLDNFIEDNRIKMDMAIIFYILPCPL